jgi:hypothetical protein
MQYKKTSCLLLLTRMKLRMNVVLPFDDHDPNAVDDSASGSNEEEDQPNWSVLDLYEKLFLLQSNPLGLERVSCEEKVQIESLELFRDLKAPHKAFSLIRHWTAKSNARDHAFMVGCQPSHKTVVRNLYTRYNMNGLMPKEKQICLPHSNRTVSVVNFNASEVFASLLLCPTLNKDANFLFSNQKNLFAAPLCRHHKVIFGDFKKNWVKNIWLAKGD